MRHTLFILLALVVFAACKKTEEAKTLQDTLRSGKWKQSAGKAKVKGPGIDTTVNYYADTNLYANCLRDNYLMFKQNFDGAVNAGGIKCSTDEPNERSFTWQLFNNGKSLNIDGAEDYFNTENVQATINSISDNSFSITYIVYETPQAGVIDTFTYTNTYSKF